MLEMIPGRIGQLILLIVVLVAVAIGSRVALKRKWKARAISGIDKLDDWIKQTGQLKRSVFFSVGTAGVGSTDTLAALALLRYVAKLCVQNNVRLIIANSDLNVQQITEEILKDAYTAAGKSDMYDVDSVRYMSGSIFAYAAGVMGLLRRERPALNIFLGAFSAESLEVAEAGRSTAMYQFGGTSSIDQLPFFLATCDLTLLAGELYAAQSYLTNDPWDISRTVGEDVGKTIAILLILAGTVLLSLGSDFILNLLNL